jgi:hypothetical protein
MKFAWTFPDDRSKTFRTANPHFLVLSYSYFVTTIAPLRDNASVKVRDFWRFAFWSEKAGFMGYFGHNSSCQPLNCPCCQTGALTMVVQGDFADNSSSL